MRTEFTANSPVGQVWQAIRQDCTARGKAEEVCAAELHTGFVDNVTLLPLRTYLPDTLTAGEVLEHAYRFDRYWPLLVKHGFPVPFAVDDYDPVTTDDGLVRESLQAAAAQATAAVMSQGLAPETDAYLHAVATTLYDWGVQHLDFPNDCPEEADAVAAWQRHCGACSETSYLMYRLFQYAGLSPVFAHIASPSPTLDAYQFLERLPARLLWAEHVFVGVMDQRGQLLQVDVALHRFDAQYAGVHILTPRQTVAAAWYGNRLTGLDQSGAGDVAAEVSLLHGLFAVAPRSFLAWQRTCDGDAAVTARMGEACQKNPPHLMNYPITSPWVVGSTLLRAALNGQEAIFFEMDRELSPAVRALGAVDLDAGAGLAFRLAVNALRVATVMAQEWPIRQARPDWPFTTAIVSDLRRKAVMLLRESLGWQPGRVPAYVTLQRIAAQDRSLLAEVRAACEHVAETWPTHAVAHFNAALMRLGEVASRPRAEVADDLARIQQHVEALTVLAPRHPWTRLLQAQWHAYRGEIEIAVAHLREGEKGVGNDPRFLTEAGFLYLLAHRSGDAERSWTALLERDPLYGAQALQAALSILTMDLTGADRVASVSEGQVPQDTRGYWVGLRLAARLGQRDAEAGARQAIRFGLMALLEGDTAAWQFARPLLPPEWPASVGKTLGSELEAYGRMLLSAPEPHVMTQLTPARADAVLSELLRLLVPQPNFGDPELGTRGLMVLCLGLAKQHLWAKQYPLAAKRVAQAREYDYVVAERLYADVARPFLETGDYERFFRAIQMGSPTVWEPLLRKRLMTDLESLLAQPHLKAAVRRTAKALLQSVAE
ncbi:MAG: hypothetical protein HY696_11710 [Deltaproteobacteria bacterium]|nr:hypothetical protein [Deltaproteobacteria bacterium]